MSPICVQFLGGGPQTFVPATKTANALSEDPEAIGSTTVHAQTSAFGSGTYSGTLFVDGYIGATVEGSEILSSRGVATVWYSLNGGVTKTPLDSVEASLYFPNASDSGGWSIALSGVDLAQLVVGITAYSATARYRPILDEGPYFATADGSITDCRFVTT